MKIYVTDAQSDEMWVRFADKDLRMLACRPCLYGGLEMIVDGPEEVLAELQVFLDN